MRTEVGSFRSTRGGITQRACHKPPSTCHATTSGSSLAASATSTGTKPGAHLAVDTATCAVKLSRVRRAVHQLLGDSVNVYMPLPSDCKSRAADVSAVSSVGKR